MFIKDDFRALIGEHSESTEKLLKILPNRNWNLSYKNLNYLNNDLSLYLPPVFLIPDSHKFATQCVDLDQTLLSY